MNTRNGSTEFPPRSLARNVGGFAHDVLTLTELQAELLRTDTEDCLKRMLGPVVALVVAGVTLLGCVPVALTALAFGFIAAGLSSWLAFLLATAVGLAIAAATALLGWQQLRKSPSVFERSKIELSSNVRWLKHVLSISGA